VPPNNPNPLGNPLGNINPKPLGNNNPKPLGNNNPKPLGNPESTQQQGSAAIAFATTKMKNQLTPAEHEVFDVASDVLKRGVDGMGDAGKRDMCSKLGNPFVHPRGVDNLVKAAYGVVVSGDPCSEAIAARHVEAAVDALLLSTYPDEGSRASYALSIVRRCVLRGATLESVFACRPDADKLGEALDRLHSWRALYDSDGARRVPTPWIADLCSVAMRMLNDLL
jgi:hypothetical protein